MAFTGPAPSGTSARPVVGHTDQVTTDDRANTLVPDWGLWLVVVFGLVVSGYAGSMGVEWFQSEADEAPIAFVPLFFVSAGTFALAVIVPLALLLKRHLNRP